jgi:hypothetical protein
VTESPPKPKNEEAYKLFLQASALPGDIEAAHQAIEMLKRSVDLDPAYAPALEDLAGRYAGDSWFGRGGQEALERWRVLADRAVALDPDNVIFRAGALYVAAQFSLRGDEGGLSRGQAFRALEDLIHRRPDSARLHFDASWICCANAGLLDESARECETSVLIDAQDSGARSCGVTFMLRGDYRRAMDYLHLDPGSEVARTVSIDVLLRQRKEKDALEAWPDPQPQWAASRLLLRTGLGGTEVVVILPWQRISGELADA